MRDFLQSLDEKVWPAIEIGWTKPKEAPADWDEVKIKAANFNRKAFNALLLKFTVLIICFIPIGQRFLWLGPANLHSLPHLLI